MTSHPTLLHDAQPFSGHRGFVAHARRVVADALAADALPVLMAGSRRIASVRSALGSHADHLVAVDLDVAGRNPARVLPALRKLLDENPQRRLSCSVETVRADDPADVRSERVLHDLVLRLPQFAAWNARVSCVYDTAKLPEELVTCLEREHAQAPADPLDRLDRARAEALPSRPTDTAELGVDRTTLTALRGFIRSRAQQAGLGDERVDDLVYAVNEVVTNSICHGEGRARVSIWIDGGRVVCEVRDRGWVRDPLAGRVAPDPARPSGRGLWLVNQLCDLVQLRSSPSGTTVRLFVEVG